MFTPWKSLDDQEGRDSNAYPFFCSARRCSAEHHTSKVTLDISNCVKICRSSFWSFFPLYVVFALSPIYSKSVEEKIQLSSFAVSYLRLGPVFFPSLFSAAKTIEAFYSFSHYCIFQTVCEKQWCMVELFRGTGDNSTGLICYTALLYCKGSCEGHQRDCHVRI